MTDKIAILISIAAFFFLGSGLIGIHMLLKNLSFYDLCFWQRNSLKNIKNFGSSTYNKTNGVNFYNKYSENDADFHKNSFTDLLASVYEKKTKQILFVAFFLILIIFYIFLKNIFLSFFISVMCTGIVGEFMGTTLRKRKEILENQLIEFISNMIILFKAGKEIRQVFKESLNCTKNPLKVYIKNLVNEIELNICMDTAIDNFALSTGSKEAALLANAIKINRKIGGNILIVLENIIKNLQQNLRIKSQIKTQTTQNRFSSNIITLFPLAGFIGMYFFLNFAIKDFLTSKIGNILLIAGTIFEFSGYFIIKKMLREDVV